MPSNRWAVCRGLPIGILGKPIHSSGGPGRAVQCLWTVRLQMSRAWQPSLPLKRKDLDVFGDSPLSLRGWKKIKTLKRLPDSFACVLPAQDGRQLYISSIIWDHMWKFWSVTFLFLSLRLKRLVSHPNCLIKKARVASKACRQNGDKWEGGELGDLGRTELVQVPQQVSSQALLEFACVIHKGSSTLLPRPSEAFDFHNLYILSLNATLGINLYQQRFEQQVAGRHWFFCFQNNIFFSAVGIIFLALGALAIFPQQICKLIFIERLTTSQHGFTENQPRGTNPISPSQNGNQAVNWKDAKLSSTLISRGHLFPNRNI